MSIRRMLVANRGEIARRVFRTCRDLGIETVAVFSDADAGLSFVAEADVAVRLLGNAPAETYLRGDLMVEAARSSGADAVHPGHGFLSESADFARQVMAAGLTWVGPKPESIEAMGSKVLAKKLMAAAEVPVLADLHPESVTAADMPVLVKASAGGGGRGMRVVRDVPDLAAAVEQASAEAESAFGDATVFCEPYVESARHVEVQVWGDGNANISVLGDRDCSVQRRHQKVIEEAPAPWLPDDIRQAIHAAAGAAAEAIGYVGVGTVEFLYDEEGGRFWFLEMNTRLQVEHPVTEAVTGLDLVELQIQAAEGRGARAVHVGQPGGHAVEARLYAEDPATGWQPQSGRLTRFEFPGADTESCRGETFGVRVDTGYRTGDEVSTHYDAMLAKVVAWGQDRDEAARRLTGILARARIHGVRTNRDLLLEVLRHHAFGDEELSTDFLDRHDLQSLSHRPRDEETLRLSSLAAAVVLAEQARARRAVQQGVPVSWRNVVSQPQLTRFAVDGGDDLVEARWDADHKFHVDLSGGGGAIATSAPDRSGVTRRFEVFVAGDRVDVESSLGHVSLKRLPRLPDPTDQVATGSLLAPMPGTVVSLAVEKGDQVEAGQSVLVLEAMKMQHTVTAPDQGTVTDLPVGVGDQVTAGDVLAVVETTGTTHETGEK